MYRPTVRYSEVYRNYVEDAFKATRLDRNQILRLALFVAAHTKEFNNILKSYKVSDVPLPSPQWTIEEEGFWREQNYSRKQNKNAPEANVQVQQVKIINQGGIHIKLG
jgi:hypothetical protein